MESYQARIFNPLAFHTYDQKTSNDRNMYMYHFIFICLLFENDDLESKTKKTYISVIHEDIKDSKQRK